MTRGPPNANAFGGVLGCLADLSRPRGRGRGTELAGRFGTFPRGLEPWRRDWGGEEQQLEAVRTVSRVALNPLKFMI